MYSKGKWKLAYVDGAHIISMCTASQNPNDYEPQHLIEYTHGLYPEDKQQFDEAEANATLIAAAPDLFAACQEFIRKYEYGDAQSELLYKNMKDTIEKASSE